MSAITLQFDTAADLESALLDALQNNEGHVSGIAAYLAPSADSDGGAIDDPFSQARLMRWGKALQAEGNSLGDALVAYADSWSQDWAEAVAPEAKPREFYPQSQPFSTAAGPFATTAQVLDLIRIRVDHAGSQKSAAIALGISEQFLCDVLKGRREPSGALLTSLGLRRELTYLPATAPAEREGCNYVVAAGSFCMKCGHVHVSAPPAPPAPLPGKESERDLFKVTFPHLDLEETPDSWGRPEFAKPMVDAIWYGWKHRAALSSPPTLEAAPADVLPAIQHIIQRLETIKNGAANFKGGWSGSIGNCDAAMTELRVISAMWTQRNFGFDALVSQVAALSAQAAPPDYPPHLADEVERELAMMIDRSPEPLRRLSDWLANKLDEDDWKTAERLLLGAVESVADRAQRSGVSADPLPLTDTYVQPVPDKCDRITWRGQYYHLPVSSQSQPLVEPTAARVSFLLEQKSALPHWENLMAYQSEDSARKALPVFRKTTSRDIRIVRQTREVVAVDSVAASPPQHQVKKGEPS